MDNHKPRDETCRRTAAYINFHARRRPNKIAVMRAGVPITYAALSRDMQAMTLALTGFGLKAGDTAAIGHEDLYVQLLLVFGFENLGVVTGSFRPCEGEECHGLLAAADLVLAPEPLAPAVCRRLFQITPAWVETALAQAAGPVTTPLMANSLNPLVILRSSGTTGAPKRMLLTRAMLNERLARARQTQHGLGLNSRARFFAAMHFSVGSTYMGAANCFRLGATFMFAPGIGGVADLVAYQPTHMTILPFHLRRQLERMPPSGAPGPLLPGLVVQTIGARLPIDLRRLALQKFCGDLREIYGTNEAGAIGTVDDAGVITLTGGVEAEVASEAGIAAAPGETGLLRVRGPGMAAAYMGDAKTSAAMFQNGWFYPGDLAAFTAPGRLRLVGRRSDVLNLGGIKIASADLESRILQCSGVSDIALVQPGPGIEPTQVTVCVVADAKFHLPSFLATIRSMIDFPFQVRTVLEIPRSAAGKIKRAALLEACG